MELFAKTVNSFKPLTISAKSSILNNWQDSQYASVLCPQLQKKEVKVLAVSLHGIDMSM